MTIRMAKEADGEELLSIYAPYVTDTAVTFEYELPSAEEFRKRIRRTLEKYSWLIACLDGRAAGYAYASAFKQRAAYDWAVETSVYVKRQLHGKGIGKALYVELERILRLQNILNANACIAFPNDESVAFHERMGYRMAACFTRCGYKLGKWHDMVFMEKMLGEHPEHPPAMLRVGQITPFPNLK